MTSQRSDRRRPRRLIGAAAAGVALLAGLLTGPAASATIAAHPWQIQADASPSGGELLGVSCPTSTFCTAIGQVSEGQAFGPVAERSDGETWTLEAPQDPRGGYGGFFIGVDCLSATFCQAVGTYNNTEMSTYAPIAETWNGHFWKVSRPPFPSNKGAGTGSGFDSVSCWSEDGCMAVGWAAAKSDEKPEVPLVESWDGSNWEQVAEPVLAGSLGGVSCVSASFCIAVGERTPDSATSTYPVIEMWDGHTWALVHIPAGAGLSSVSCTSTTACTAVGQKATGVPLVVRWNGSTWSYQSTPKIVGASNVLLRSVSCTGSTLCSAVGQYNVGGLNTDNLAEEWNGSAWAVQATPNLSGSTSNLLAGVSCVASVGCTAVGSANEASDGVVEVDSF